jgi:hypothetical protein
MGGATSLRERGRERNREREAEIITGWKATHINGEKKQILSQGFCFYTRVEKLINPQPLAISG